MTFYVKEYMDTHQERKVVDLRKICLKNLNKKFLLNMSQRRFCLGRQNNIVDFFNKLQKNLFSGTEICFISLS